VRATDTRNKGLLGGYAEQLKRLQSLQRITAADQLSSAVEGFPGVPASWLLGPRAITRPLSDGVQLEWRLPVEQLKQACRDSFSKRQMMSIDSPCNTPPMCGLAWGLSLHCKQREGGTVVGPFAGARDMPHGMYYQYSYTVSWGGKTRSIAGQCIAAGTMRGFRNYFPELAPMAGDGWDEAAWAAAGLPTSGEMLLQLHVHSAK
jgi:hypothetical protein